MAQRDGERGQSGSNPGCILALSIMLASVLISADLFSLLIFKKNIQSNKTLMCSVIFTRGKLKYTVLIATLLSLPLPVINSFLLFFFFFFSSLLHSVPFLSPYRNVVGTQMWGFLHHKQKKVQSVLNMLKSQPFPLKGANINTCSHTNGDIYHNLNKSGLCKFNIIQEKKPGTTPF